MSIKTLKIQFALFIFLLNSPVIYATENDISFINSIEEDITGDGLREYIRLQGKKLSSESIYYRSVWIDIEGAFQQQWKISLPSGYHPSVELIDFTHDKINEVFYTSARESEGKTHIYQLYSLEDGLLEEVPLPKKTFIQGEFSDNFFIELYLAPGNSTPIQLDRVNKSDEYVKQELYDADGKLLMKKQITSEPISHMEPILISSTKGYGLKSSQRVYGVNNHDPIGTLEAVWYYRNKKWVVLQTQFLP